MSIKQTAVVNFNKKMPSRLALFALLTNWRRKSSVCCEDQLRQRFITLPATSPVFAAFVYESHNNNNKSNMFINSFGLITARQIFDERSAEMGLVDGRAKQKS